MEQFKWVIELSKRVLGLGWWVFPATLLLGGYAVPVLRTRVLQWPIPDSIETEMFAWLAIGVAVAFIWLIAQIFEVSSERTSIQALKVTVAVSICLTLIMSGIGGWKLQKATLSWWFVVPWITSIASAFISTQLSLTTLARRVTIPGKS